jgi:hypothetical protein
MASKDKNPPAPRQTTPKFNDAKFINWSLSVEDKASCKAWLNDFGELDDALQSLVSADYKVTMSYSDFNHCYTASIVPTGEKNVNKGYILTGKGSTTLKAVKQALYIHFMIFNQDWSSYSKVTLDEELDD